MDSNLDQNAPTIGSGIDDMPATPEASTAPVAPAPSNDSPLGDSPVSAAGQGADVVGATIGEIEHDSAQSEAAKTGEKKKNSKKSIIIIAIIAVVAVLGAIAALLILPKLGGSGQRLSGVRENNAFFIDESRDSYRAALFNNDGEKLSEFVYTDYSDFVGGYAKVKDANSEEFSVIDTQGNASIKAGKYKSIDAYNGLYVVSDGAKSQLVTAGDQVITEVSDAGADLIFQGGVAAVILHEKDNQYSIYNLNGERLAQFSSSVAPTVVYDETKMADYAFIFAERHVYVINNRDYSLKMDAEIERSYTRINEASKTQRAAILSGDAGFAYYYNGKFLEIKDSCDSVELTKAITGYYAKEYSRFAENAEAAECRVDYKDSLVSAEHGGATNTTLDSTNAYYSPDTYAVSSSVDGERKVELYKDGNKVKDVLDGTLALGVDNAWSITKDVFHGLDEPYTHEVGLYDFDGNTIFAYNSAENEQLPEICTAYPTHQQDRVVVRMPNEERQSCYSGNYQLLDSKKEQLLGEPYYRIYSQVGYFVAMDELSKYVLLNSDGKATPDATYEKIDISHTGFITAQQKDTDGKTKVDIINSSTLEVVATADSYSDIMVKNGNYLRVTAGGKNQFYTTTGKLFYTQE